MPLVTLSTASPSEYRAEPILLQPGHFPARTGPSFGQFVSYITLRDTLASASRSQFVAVDFETRGGDISGDIAIVGVGLAWDTGSCYIHWADMYSASRDLVLHFLFTHSGLIAHNVYFDAGVLLREASRHRASPPAQLDAGVLYRAADSCYADWHACTYALLALLHNEGYPDVTWSLKKAQVDLLGWEVSNEGDLDEWLVSRGFYRGPRRKETDPAHLTAMYQAGGIHPDKGEMWRAPREILGKYCCLDAEACYLLYTQVLLPVYEQFPGMAQLFTEFMFLIRTLVIQKIGGIDMDREGLLSRQSFLVAGITEATEKFLRDPRFTAGMRSIEASLRAGIYEKMPEQFKKDGTTSKNYLNKMARIAEIEAGQDPAYNFNINSGDQLRALLYTHLGFPVRVETPTGQAATGVKAYKHMGEVGALLSDRAALVKELSYIEKYLELTETRPTIHPSFRTPGTVTGRLSSKEPNLQQVTKTKAMMSLFRARPGHVWVDFDFAALESVVAAEFSEDPNLLALYGDGVPENDVHLFVAAHVPGEMAEKVKATGYTPYNPPPGTVARAKKEAKAIRSIAKTVVYACIAEGSLILTRDHGLVPIESIGPGEQVWDGQDWVTTAGSVRNGEREVMRELGGVGFTEDHLICATDGKFYERKVYQGTKGPQPVRPRIPRRSWGDVWKLVCSIFSSYGRKRTSQGQSEVLPRYKVSELRQLAGGEINGMQELQISRQRKKTVEELPYRHAGSMLQENTPVLSVLWGTWNKCRTVLTESRKFLFMGSK